MNLSHLLRLTDDTGILQHARYSLVDRDHGYTTDDNAQALLFTVEAPTAGIEGLDESGAALLDLQARYLSFVDHAFDPTSGRFRAYMRFDRTWAPERSKDADGRAIWSLGTCAARSNDAGLRSATRELMHRALPSADGVTSPRAWAHTLLGLNAYLERHADDAGPLALQAELAGRLRHHFERHMQPNWPWPEECLTYDNARLPQALIASGRALGDARMVDLGLRVVEWLDDVQTERGLFAPIGDDGWFPLGGENSRFDRQPLEASGPLEACRDAIDAGGGQEWLAAAQRALRWFLGGNTLGTAVRDEESGAAATGLRRAARTATWAPNRPWRGCRRNSWRTSCTWTPDRSDEQRRSPDEAGACDAR
jgi:hypothetical protein